MAVYLVRANSTPVQIRNICIRINSYLFSQHLFKFSKRLIFPYRHTDICMEIVGEQTQSSMKSHI